MCDHRIGIEVVTKDTVTIDSLRNYSIIERKLMLDDRTVRLKRNNYCPDCGEKLDFRKIKKESR